ncbi:STAS domain-containing protein [Rufibacter latericius]|uniref:Anti-sigma factor antagonist n=1 Tax=Rufibacter latericius TaxID=2487040 RepID=A0A3M9M8D6_9BACT|nr:STAS domain-containing protein [Rufibacter latericius]RNI21829.1 anti-sigma factor antagonist [Rufibacter latericius]
MEISTQITSAGLLVFLKGALDSLAEEKAKLQLKALFQFNRKYLFLDFSGVTEVTPTGLRNLLPYVQQVQQQKKELILFNIQENMHALITSSGFDSLVKVVDSLDSAIKYVDRKKGGGN